MEGSLRKLRILEIGHLESAGIAGMILSDLGMEVIRVDTPLSAEPEVVQSSEDAVTFGLAAGGDRICDRGKKRVFLDLRNREHRELFVKILASCNGLLDGCGSRVLADLGLGGKKLRALLPGLVYTQVSGYGSFGPYRNRLWSEAAIQAESGFVSTTGLEGDDPVRCGGDIATALGGLMTCIAMLMGLVGRQKSPQPQGRQIDVSLMDTLLFGLENQFSLYLKSGIVPKPKGNHYALSAPVGNFICKDGKEIMISVATESQWQAFAQALGREDWLMRLEFSNVSQRIIHYKLLGRELSAEFIRHTQKEVMELLQSRKCVYGCINDFPAVIMHRQVVLHKLFGKIVGSDSAVFFAPTSPVACHLPSDALRIHPFGADTNEILTEISGA